MSKMKQWYVRDGYYKKRLLHEIEYIKHYREKYPQDKITYDFCGELQSFCVWYKYDYKGKVLCLFCTYPLLYPKTRIEVRVYYYDVKKREIIHFQKGYHNTDGVLCLLLHYPNQWDENYGIEYIIKRVDEWFKDGQDDKSNNIPLDYNINNKLFIIPELLTGDVTQQYGIFEFYHIREKLCIVTELNTRNQRISITVDDIPESLWSEDKKIERGIILFTSKPINSKIPVVFSDIQSYLNCFKYGVKGFLDFAKNNGIVSPIPLVIIYKNQNYEGQAFYIKEANKLLEIDACRFTNFRVYEDIFSREHDIDALGFLKRKRVALIGLGAIGSTVASELARSGIGNFILIDNEKIEIQNIGRHDLTLRDIDKFKVDGVKEKILDINAKAKCQSYSFNVLDDYSFNLYSLFSCDLVISTMDD